MILTPKTFNRFPSMEQMEETLKTLMSYTTDVASYMWLLLPLSEKLGEQVFDVAAKSLTESGVEVTAEEMKELARDMRLPEKQEHYKKKRLEFLNSEVTYCKGV